MVMQPQNSSDPTFVFYFDLLRLQPIFKASLFWINAERTRLKRTFRFRSYYDGDHDAKLTPEMRKMLRISDPDDGFTLNMMPTVVDTKADRCIVQSIDGVTATAGGQKPTTSEDEQILKDPLRNPSAWIQQIMEDNHFDILQGEIHQGAIRDGDSFLMLSYDNDEQCVKWTFEEAFDGYSGMLAYYPSRNDTRMAAAVKIWQIDDPGSLSTFNILTRVNIYYPDRIEKYVTQGMGALAPDNTAKDAPKEPQFGPYIDKDNLPDGAQPGTEHIWPWVDKQGEPLGIPVVHFRNAGRHNYGVSELRNAISPQNALNRFNYSMVMTAELTAFSILVARGHKPPATITPGMIYDVTSGAPMDNTMVADLTRLQPGDMQPILEAIDKERHLIADITRTPSPDLMGSSGSGSNKTGEYLKQLEIGLLGKVRVFQVRAGASWEEVADKSWDLQAAFGTVQPPDYKRFLTKWRPAELRDNTQVVQAAVLMDPIWGHEQTLHATASVFELDEDTIAKIVTQQKEEMAQAQAMQAQSNQPADTVNPGKGTVKVSEPSQTITASGDQQSGSQPPNGNKPAVRGNKLPTDQALKVNPISHAEMAAVGALHRGMVGK